MEQERVNYKSLTQEYLNTDSLQYKKLKIVDSYIEKGNLLLDIGAGTGELISLENHKFNQTYGIDTDTESIMICKNRFNSKSNINIFQMDLDTFHHNFTDKKFDCITCLDILEHVDLNTCKKMLYNIYNMTNEGGHFIFTGPGIFEKIRIFLGKSPTHLHSHSSYGWSVMIQNTGFKILNVETVAFPIIDNDILRKKIHIFGKCCLIVAQKVIKE